MGDNGYFAVRKFRGKFSVGMIAGRNQEYRFIKEPHIKMVLVVRTDGTIAAATNKKREGRQFSSFCPVELLSPDDIRISRGKDATILLVCPVMGLHASLGTTVVIYELE